MAEENSSLPDVIEENPNLNPTPPGRWRTMLDEANQNNGALVIKQAVKEIYEMAAEVKEGGPYNAVCLAATENPTGNIPLKKNYEGSVTQVIARIPRLHDGIPIPRRSGPSGLGCPAKFTAAIMMHPIFYAETGNHGSLPQAGNIVRVNFSEGETKYGEYLGIVDPKSVSSDEEESAAEKVEDVEATPVTNEDSAAEEAAAKEGCDNG